MKEECLICKAPLEYLETDVLMECEIFHKKENSKSRCVNGHYVCNDCHTQGLDSIIGLCMKETSKNPIAICRLQRLCRLFLPAGLCFSGLFKSYDMARERPF